jgi:hypothetical protein
VEHSPKQTIPEVTKQVLKKYKKTEITTCILSDNNSIKLELNNESKLKILKQLEDRKHVASSSESSKK